MPYTTCQIWTETDNTVREGKNRFVLSWLHQQVQRLRFRSGSLMLLRKSHTHDRIGRVSVCFGLSHFMCPFLYFSVFIFLHFSSLPRSIVGNIVQTVGKQQQDVDRWGLLNCFLVCSMQSSPVRRPGCQSWQCQDMMAILREECAKPGLRSWVGINTEIAVRKINVALIEWWKTGDVVMMLPSKPCSVLAGYVLRYIMGGVLLWTKLVLWCRVDCLRTQSPITSSWRFSSKTCQKSFNHR